MSISFAYAPWMANYTEQVESHNPALTASGLAVWGWILRITVALSFLVLPYVITTSTVLVDNQNAGATLQAIQAAAALRTEHVRAEVQRRARAGARHRQLADDRRGTARAPTLATILQRLQLAPTTCSRRSRPPVASPTPMCRV